VNTCILEKSERTKIISMFVLLSLILAEELDYVNVSTTDDDVQLADDYIHAKLHLIYNDITTNNVRIIPERAQIAKVEGGQYVRVYQRIQRYQTIVTVYLSNQFKVHLVSIVPETTNEVAGGYNFHDPATLDPELLNSILTLLANTTSFSGSVGSLVEYRTHVDQGLHIHIVFYDDANVLSSVEYYVDLGTSPNRITSYVTELDPIPSPPPPTATSFAGFPGGGPRGPGAGGRK
jgi:hypothetical protein